MSHKNTCLPFYISPTHQKRSAQIIKEAKAEIKKLESHRPLTPFIGRRIDVGTRNGRPSSCTSIKSLIYEPEENFNVLGRKKSTTKNNIGEGGIKLQPLVTKTVLKSRKSSSCLKVVGEAAFTGFPPLPCEDDKTCIKNTFDDAGDGSENGILHEKDSENGILHEKDSENGILHEKDSENGILHENEPSLAKEHDGVPNELDELVSLHYLNLRSDVNPNANEELFNLCGENETVVDSVSKDIIDFFPLLERYIQLGRKVKEEDAVRVVKKIYRLLEENGSFLFIFESRTPLLKLLFKLLDTHFPVLSLNIVKLLLQMKIKDKNLCSAFRLVLRLIKDEKINLNDYQLVERIFEVMSNMSVKSNSEAVMYGIRILKDLLCTLKLKTHQSEMCINIFTYQLRELNIVTSKGGWDSDCMEIIALVVSSFRYLIEEDILWQVLIKVETLTEILNVLVSCSQSTESVQIVVRLISKIMDKEDGCESLSNCPLNILLSFLSLTETYRYNIDVTLQVTFIIGKLVSFDEKIALTFVTSSNFLSTIIVIGEYIDEHLKFKGSVSDCFKTQSLMTGGDRNWRDDIFQVILKILCIWANICLHPEAGLHLARRQEVVSNLLAIIAAYSETEGAFDRSVALRSFLVVIGNISYYLESDSELCIKTTECVVPLLDDSFANEVRFEAANVIRNLTRISDVRQYIQEHALLSAFIKLLSEDNKEFCIGAYGIIMNLLIDASSRQIFYEQQGVTRILHKLHLCSDRDWKTSAFLCQILWNYCGGENAENISISEVEAQHLIRYLSYSTRTRCTRISNSILNVDIIKMQKGDLEKKI